VVVASPPKPRRKAALSPPISYGPSWQRDRRGFVLPQYTLGWEILGWCAKYLLIPDGPMAGEPWKFTDEQTRLLLWWYAVDREGRFAYRRGTLRRMKGWGKDPFTAVLCAVEFIGPCRFKRFEGSEPIGVRHGAGWVQVAAVALEQTRTTMTLFPGLFSRRAIDEFKIDVGKEIIYGMGGRSRIEALTTSSRAQEGPRPTFAFLNETHHWLLANEGHSMRQTIMRNLAKTGGRALAGTNAHNPGEGSVAEADWDAYQQVIAGTTRATGILYDSLEAPPDVVMSDPESLRAGLVGARGDSLWLDVDRLMEEIYDPETPASVSRRYYLNQITAAEDAWLSADEWDACADPEHVVPDGAIITLGFDGSKTGDHTALVGCEVETGHLFTVAVWDPANEPDGEINRLKVDAAVAGAFKRYDVVGFYADRSPWESYVDKWAEQYGDQLCAKVSVKQPVEWNSASGKATTEAQQSFKAAILDHDSTHEGSATARYYVLNGRAFTGTHGVYVGKENRNSARKIDWLDAAILARQSRQDYIALPDNKKRQQKSIGVMFV
jgi:hypothetical protein